jgi:hypothetical protein
MIKYRYASDISSMTVTVDQTIAIGVILVSLMFWIGYVFLKQHHIEHIKSFFFQNKKNEESGISNCKFYVYIFFILTVIVLYYICQYMKFDKFDLMFLQGYHARDEILQINLNTSMTMRIINRIISSCFLIITFISLLLLFETLRKYGKKYSYFLIITMSIIALLTMTVFFLATGFRTYTVSCMIVIVTLIVIAQIRSLQRLRKISIPIVIFMLLYCMLFFVTLRQFRWSGIEGLYSRSCNVFTDYKLIQQSLKDNFFVPKKTVQTESVQKQTIDLSHSYINNNAIPRINEEIKDENLAMIKQNAEIHVSQEIIQEKMKELQYIQSLPIYGHSTSREIAWIMIYFGRHEKYMGITTGFRAFANEILPPPFGREPSFVSPVRRLEQLKRGNAEGPFADGYISYGLVGGYLYWGIWAFICGLFAKFAVVDIFMSTPCLESNSLSLCLLVHVSVTLCSSRGYLSPMIIGFGILWISVAIIIRFYNLSIRPRDKIKNA